MEPFLDALNLQRTCALAKCGKVALEFERELMG